MVLREINAPLEDVSVHDAGLAFKLAGDNLHPVAPAESVVETHALEGIDLAGAGARNTCQFIDKNVDKRAKSPGVIMNALVHSRRKVPRKQGYMNLLVRTATNSKTGGGPGVSPTLTFGTNS